MLRPDSQQDQEVLEAAISCTGVAATCLGDLNAKQTIAQLEVGLLWHGDDSMHVCCTASGTAGSGLHLRRQELAWHASCSAIAWCAVSYLGTASCMPRGEITG